MVAGRDLRPAIIRQFIWKCGLGLTCWAAWDQAAPGGGLLPHRPRAPPRSESCLPPLVPSLVTTAALVKLSQIATRWEGRSVNIAGRRRMVEESDGAHSIKPAAGHITVFGMNSQLGSYCASAGQLCKLLLFAAVCPQC